MKRVKAILITATLSLFSVLSSLAADGEPGTPRLLNVNFAVPTANVKTGPAAVGLAESDFWNVFDRDSRTVLNAPNGMKWSDGALAGARLTVENADGAWGSGAADPMLQTYLYPIGRSGNIVATFTQVPSFRYDVYVYAHGAENENAVVELRVNNISLGERSTSSAANWDPPGWVEGSEYVVFRAVDVPANAALTVISKPGAGNLAVINGAQLITTEAFTGAPRIIYSPQPASIFNGESASFSVSAVGGGTLQYRWRKGEVDVTTSDRITGVNTPTLTINNAIAEDAGTYTVIVSNDLGEATASAELTVGSDILAPVVTITSPAAGEQAQGTFVLEGAITDNRAVASARWEWNGTDRGSLNVQNGTFRITNLSFAVGENRIRVMATDASGNQGAAEVVAVFTVSRSIAVGAPAATHDGARFTVPITLASTGGVGGATFTLAFDPSALADAQFEWNSDVDLGFKTFNLEQGRRFVASFSLPGTTLPEGEIRLANASFRVRSLPQNSSTTLGMTLAGMYNSSGDPYTTGNHVGSATASLLRRRIIGDNNANDRFDVGDATLMQRLIARLDAPRPWDASLNDLNLNAQLDSGDVIRVLRAVVGLDPQPELPPMPPPPLDPIVGMTAQQIELLVENQRAPAGERVNIRVRLINQSAQVSGASFRLEYPVDALRLEAASSHAVGALVPAGTLAFWNVAPSQNNYTTQNGSVSLAVSSANAWPNNNGILAQFSFTAQPGATARYGWPLRLSAAEITRDGFVTESLRSANATYLGRDHASAAFEPAIAFGPGGATVTLRGDFGATYLIEASNDLRAWQSLGVQTSADGAIVVEDTNANGATSRFYRATLVQ